MAVLKKTASSNGSLKNPWKKISSKIVHENPWYSVRRDEVIQPNGQKGEYNVIVRRSSVFIVALTEHDKLLLIGVYRYATDRYSIEIPAGAVEDGERPRIAAKRELMEETGFKAKQWNEIGKFQVINGLSNEIGVVFLARGLVQTGHNKQKEEGIYETRALSIGRVLQMIKDGEITDGQTIVAVSYVVLMRRLDENI